MRFSSNAAAQDSDKRVNLKKLKNCTRITKQMEQLKTQYSSEEEQAKTKINLPKITKTSLQSLFLEQPIISI